MKTRSILFQSEMVKAILHGSKSQTRRVIKPTAYQKRYVAETWNRKPTPVEWNDMAGQSAIALSGAYDIDRPCPYGKPGDVIYVRETYCALVPEHAIDAKYAYRADIGDDEYRQAYIRAGYPYQWKPSLFMPKAAARIWLEITGIRAERLQDISWDDAIAEGYTYKALHVMHEKAAGMNLMRMPDDPILWYSELWNAINGKGSWDANPFVWCVEFRKIDKPNTQP